MKTRIHLIVFVLALVISCRDEDAIRFPDFQNGVSARVLFDPNRTFIDLDNLSTSELGLDIYTENTDIQKIDYSVVFTDFDSAELFFPPIPIFTVLKSDFVDGKASVTVTAGQLAETLGVPGGLGWFSGGDSFTFVPTATLDDGRVFSPANSAASISGNPTSSFSALTTAFVGCASPAANITGTTYTASIVTLNTAGLAPFGLPNTNTIEGVTIIAPGPEPFRYRVSSHDAGWWGRPDITDTEGGTGDFYDICGTIITLPIASFGYGGALNWPGGSYDPATGIIKMNWYNSTNDIYGFVTYVPEN